MSDAQGQEEYISSLKQIKEIEDKAHLEIESHRKISKEEKLKMEKDLKDSIYDATERGKKLVEESIEQARTTAMAEAEKIILDAEQKSKSISFSPDQKAIKEIIQILISGL